MSEADTTGGAPPRGRNDPEPEGWPYGYSHTLEVYRDGKYVDKYYIGGARRFEALPSFRLLVEIHDGDTTNHPDQKHDDLSDWVIIGGSKEIVSELGPYRMVLYPNWDESKQPLY